MKILYGVQGTGNGHIARARIMANACNERADVDVQYLFSGRDVSQYFDTHIFGDFITRAGLSFATNHGKVSRWHTLKNARLSQLWEDINSLDVSGYDLVISDFEPVSAWAAWRQGVPSIAISHQATFTFDVPSQHLHLLSSLITRYFAPCRYRLGVHWYHYGQPVIPPFISEKATSLTSGNNLLVYLPFEEPNDVCTFLAPFTAQQFDVFHPRADESRMQSHVNWHKPSKSRFREAQHRCAGVIANGGFELASECLSLGKKMLLKPLTGQFEQASNILTLKSLNLCSAMDSLDQTRLADWLSHSPPPLIRFPSEPDPLIDWLLKGEWHEPQGLCRQLWEQVSFPPTVIEKLASA